MKQIHYLLIALICGLFTACQDGDWDEPSFKDGAPFGNNSITEDGLITIAELIEKYPNVFEYNDRNVLIEEDIKIKGRISGNDLGGNIYKQIFIQDHTRAICIAINQGGLNGFLAEGQEVLVDLKGLYIGGYRMMPEIGQPYNGNSIGRMSKDIWSTHFKLIGEPVKDSVLPVEFSEVMGDKDANCGKLVKLTNVTFTAADGKAVYAGKEDPTNGGNYVNKTVKYNGQDVIIRTSTYADFAAMPLPYDEVTGQAKTCTITAIASRFSNDWQLLIRKTSDIQ